MMSLPSKFINFINMPWCKPMFPSKCVICQILNMSFKFAKRRTNACVMYEILNMNFKFAKCRT